MCLYFQCDIYDVCVWVQEAQARRLMEVEEVKLVAAVRKGSGGSERMDDKGFFRTASGRPRKRDDEGS